MSTTLSLAAETLLREFAEPGTYFVTQEDWPLVDELEKAGLVTSKRGAHAVWWKVYPTEEGVRRAQTLRGMTQTPDTLSDLQRAAHQVADLSRAGSVAALAAAIKLERARKALAQATPPTAEVAAARDQVAAMLDSYHAPTLLLAAAKCERAALLDPAQAGDWIARSGRLRELALAAHGVGC